MKKYLYYLFLGSFLIFSAESISHANNPHDSKKGLPSPPPLFGNHLFVRRMTNNIGLYGEDKPCKSEWDWEKSLTRREGLTPSPPNIPLPIKIISPKKDRSISSKNDQAKDSFQNKIPLNIKISLPKSS